MKRSLGLAVLVFGIATAGCNGGFQQNPLKGQNNLIPPPPRDASTIPVPTPDTRYMIIDVNSPNDFKEGEEGSVDITGRVLDGGTTQFALNIDNLSDFQGATVELLKPGNPMAGIKFRWTPPIGYASDEVQSVLLHISMHTTNLPVKGTTIAQAEIDVHRDNIAPTIVSVDDFTKPPLTPLREGNKYQFNVVVRDPNGIDTNGGRPELTALPDHGSRADLSHFIFPDQDYNKPNPVQDPKDPTLWHFVMDIDLTDANITKSDDTFSFELRANSRLGIPSVVKHVDALVRTAVLKPVTTWTSVVNVVAGQDTTFSFLVYDPKEAGRISVNFLALPDSTLGAATWDCPPVDPGTPTTCTIRWKVPAAVSQLDYFVPMELVNTSPIDTDGTVVKTRVVGKIHVVFAAPKPSPNPNPVPAPGPTPSPTPDDGNNTPPDSGQIHAPTHKPATRGGK